MRIKELFKFLFISILILLIAFIYYTWRSNFPWFWQYFMFEWQHKLTGLPFLIPYLFLVFSSSWKMSTMFWGLLFALLLPLLIYYNPSRPDYVIMNILVLSLPFIVNTVITFALEKKRAFEQLESERQKYVAEVLNAQDNERKHLSQELHDDVAQELLVLANKADEQILQLTSQLNLNNEHELGKAVKNAEWSRDRLRRLFDNIRRLCMDLRPAILDDVGLASALTWLADRLYNDSNIEAIVKITGEPWVLPSEIETGIFRIVQEALNNIRRHSNATEAKVLLYFMPNHLQVTIVDNGKGFEIPIKYSEFASLRKIGIMNMQQRAQILKADLQINSKIGLGTSIVLEVKI